jgi:hypothetical protein
LKASPPPDEDEEEEAAPTSGDRSRAFVALVGGAALLAWFALLWFMFGDVL